MVLLLLLVKVLGRRRPRLQRWINLGIRIQPSEVGKVLLIITLGHHLSELSQARQRLDGYSLADPRRSPAALVFLQPNLGPPRLRCDLVRHDRQLGCGCGHIALFLVALIIAVPIVWTRLKLLRPHHDLHQSGR
jgi:hypothetical protein